MNMDLAEKISLLSLDKKGRNLSELVLKMCEEVGEVSKQTRKPKGKTWDEWRDETILEAGDVLSALAKTIVVLGCTFEEVVDAALEKREL